MITSRRLPQPHLPQNLWLLAPWTLARPLLIMNLSINRGLIGLASCSCLVYEGLAPLKRLLNPPAFEGSNSPPSKPQRLGDKTSKNVSTLSRALSIKGFKGFRVIKKRFQGIPHTNTPDGAYHVPMRFSQVVKVSSKFRGCSRVSKDIKGFKG